MTKKESATFATQLAVIDSKLDTVIKVMDAHIKSSDEYRTLTTNNCDTLLWHNKWLYTVSAGVLICLSLLTGISLIGR
jgi:hypothetical protein